jgi:hypothetical protein
VVAYAPGGAIEPPDDLIGTAHDPAQQLGAAGQVLDAAGDLAGGRMR